MTFCRNWVSVPEVTGRHRSPTPPPTHGLTVRYPSFITPPLSSVDSVDLYGGKVFHRGEIVPKPPLHSTGSNISGPPLLHKVTLDSVMPHQVRDPRTVAYGRIPFRRSPLRARSRETPAAFHVVYLLHAVVTRVVALRIHFAFQHTFYHAGHVPVVLCMMLLL